MIATHNTNAINTGRRIVIVGCGGQGVLTVARVLCDYLAGNGQDVVSGQLHGMAQRGGSVQATLSVDCGASPVVAAGRADVVLGFEPVETARALAFMSPDTTVFMNTRPVTPYVLAQQQAVGRGPGQYPDIEDLAGAIRSVSQRVCVFDATDLAQRAGGVRAMNMVMLGCLVSSGDLGCTPNALWEFVTDRMPPAARDTNTKAFFSGVEVGQKFAKSQVPA